MIDEKKLNETDGENTLDLGQFFRYLLSKCLWILLAVALCVALAFGYTRFLVKPAYRSTAALYVNCGSSATDLNNAALIAKDYVSKLSMRDTDYRIINAMAEDGFPGATVGEIDRSLDLSISTGADRIICITATSNDPARAQEMAAVICRIATEEMEKIGTEKVTVEERPNNPSSAYNLRYGRNLLLGALIGLVGSVGVLLLVYMLADKVQSGKQLEEYFGLSVLATLPHEQHEHTASAHAPEENSPPRDTPYKTIMLHDCLPLSFSGREACKLLRTNLMFSGSDLRTIAVASCQENEGKTTTTMALGRSLSDAGHRVLVIDADMRKSVVAGRYSQGEITAGLSQYLTGQATREEVTFSTQYPGMDIIFAGYFPPNPVELLDTERFRALLSEVRTEYDYVLVDNAPIAAVVDATIVARSCDGILLVVGANRTSRRLLRDCLVQIRRSGCRVLGAVMNCVQRSHMPAYYHKSYRYYDGEHTGKTGEQAD